VGIILSHGGELRDADRYLERCLELYQPDPLYFTYWGVDPGVAGHAQLARVQWLRGYPDRAHRSVSAAVELGERLTHPHSLAMGLFFGAWVHQLRRDVRRTLKLASAAISICAGHGFRMIEAWAKSLAGWATAEQGDTAAGIEMLRASLAQQRQIGVEIIRPHFLGLLAALHMNSGRNDEARDLVDQALDLAQVTGDRYYEPELHRLSGELCLAGPVSGGATAAAEDRFRRALETARSQDSRSLELRAAMSLGRVLAKTGRREEARELVIPTYQWFSEGWETADLREARALTETLRQ
jgi:predicted ATPase